MSVTLGDLETKVGLILNEVGADEDLGSVSLRDCVKEAVRAGYSKDRPEEKVVEVTGTGAFDYAITTLTGYVEGFSTITKMEYPVDDTSQEQDFLEEDEWELYRKPSGLFLRFKEATPATSEKFRATFTVPYQFTTSNPSESINIPVTDVDAVSNLAASVAFGRMASKFARESDPTIGADTVDHKSKDSRYRALARDYARMYREHIGKPSEAVAAGGFVDWDPKLQTGVDRLTHPKRQR